MTDKATPTPASVDSVMALKKLLSDIAAMLSPTADSYASDDPSGAIETAYSVAVEAIDICAEVERLAAQAAPTERDAQDAARYRWLRDGELTADYPYPVMRMGGSRVDDQTIWADELDAAIDDAISAAQHPQQEQSK